MNLTRVASLLSPATRDGLRDAAPVIAAYVPFGLALGATMGRAHVSHLLAWSTSPVLYGGAAQLLTVQLLGSGTTAMVVVLSALVVNGRFLLYSASLAPHAREWPSRWRWASAYLLVDPVYALSLNRFGRRDRYDTARSRLWYYLAVGAAFWLAWQTITGAGVALAGALPPGLRLELAAPLTFLLLLLPMLTTKAARGAAATGSVVAVIASGLPLGLGLLAGAAAGIAAGTLMERRDE